MKLHIYKADNLGSWGRRIVSYWKARTYSIPFCSFTFPLGSHQLLDGGSLLYPCCCAQSCGEHRSVHVSPSHWLTRSVHWPGLALEAHVTLIFEEPPHWFPSRQITQPLWVSASLFLRWEQQPCWLRKSHISMALNPSFSGLLVFLIICCQSKQPQAGCSSIQTQPQCWGGWGRGTESLRHAKATN